MGVTRLETQQQRWALAKAKPGLIKDVATGARAGWRASLFDHGKMWTRLTTETLNSVWQVVSIEPMQDVRRSTVFRSGDTVLVEIDEEGMPNPGIPLRATISGFVGSLVRVSLEVSGERLVQWSAVRALEEEGLYLMTFAVGTSLQLHHCEVMVPRRVILALESEFSPEDKRCEMRPRDLTNGLRVWAREPNEQRRGHGVITMAAPDIGMCGVTWASSGVNEVLFAADLERQCGSAARVVRDPPRNMKHACLVELELDEAEFQRQQGESE